MPLNEWLQEGPKVIVLLLFIRHESWLQLIFFGYIDILVGCNLLIFSNSDRPLEWII